MEGHGDNNRDLSVWMTADPDWWQMGRGEPIKRRDHLELIGSGIGIPATDLRAD